MKVGNLIEHNTGHIGVVTDIRMMYPGHPMSPVEAVRVKWQDSIPPNLHTSSWFSVFSIRKVLSSTR